MSEKQESENKQAASSGVDDPPCSVLGVGDLFKSKLTGHLSELATANYLRGYGYTLFFPPGSRGPADLLAVRKDSLLAVQCKSSVLTLNRSETEWLVDFAEPIGATPVFTCRIDGRTKWHILGDENKWHRIPPPKWRTLKPNAKDEASTGTDNRV